MTLARGDVITVPFPFSSGAGAKLRPALVVQSDVNNRRLTNVIVAAITTTTHRSGQPTQHLVPLASAAGRQSGLIQDSVVSCENLATIEQSLVRRKLGSLPADAMREIDTSLKAALGIA